MRDPLTDSIATILSDAAKLILIIGIAVCWFIIAMGGAEIMGRLP